jgi:hypothetical protein
MRFSPMRKFRILISALVVRLFFPFRVMSWSIPRKIFGVTTQITIVNTMYYVRYHNNVKVVL